MKFPKIIIPRRRNSAPPQPPREPKKLQARTRSAEPVYDDYDYEDDEPRTKLTSAFVVVLVLHIVAVGGIYAFNQIKASRPRIEASAQPKPEVKTSTGANTDPAAGAAAAAVAPAQETAPPVASVTPTSRQRVYNVRSGDTLAGIAKSFDMSVSELKSVNGLTSDIIRPGQILNLVAAGKGQSAESAASPAPSTRREPAEAKPAVRTYTVKSGDRLIFIAKKYGVTPEAIIALNKIKDPTKLQINQTIKIPAKK